MNDFTVHSPHLSIHSRVSGGLATMSLGRTTTMGYYTTLTNFSTKYLVMCKVYTDLSGINSSKMFVHLYVR